MFKSIYKEGKVMVEGSHHVSCESRVNQDLRVNVTNRDKIKLWNKNGHF